MLGEPPDSRPEGAGLLDRVVDWLLARDAATALITTNYDLAVESRLFSGWTPGRWPAKSTSG